MIPATPWRVKTRKHPRSVLASKIRPLLLGSTVLSSVVNVRTSPMITCHRQGLLLRVRREPGHPGDDEGIHDALPVGQQVGLRSGLADLDEP
jgi:hypothetical protein